jgi:hypothetical protein
MKNGALGKKFDAYLKRQFMTESSYNNSLADHHIWLMLRLQVTIANVPSSAKLATNSFDEMFVFQSGFTG